MAGDIYEEMHKGPAVPDKRIIKDCPGWVSPYEETRKRILSSKFVGTRAGIFYYINPITKYLLTA